MRCCSKHNCNSEDTRHCFWFTAVRAGRRNGCSSLSTGLDYLREEPWGAHVYNIFPGRFNWGGPSIDRSPELNKKRGNDKTSQAHIPPLFLDQGHSVTSHHNVISMSHSSSCLPCHDGVYLLSRLLPQKSNKYRPGSRDVAVINHFLGRGFCTSL